MALAQLYQSAVQLQRLWRREGFQFCFIGGIACQRWGQPRATRDLDLTLLTGFGREAEFIDRVLANLQPRIRDARGFAIRNRVILARDNWDTPIDIALGAMPFEQRTVERASPFHVSPDDTIVTCSASDFVVLKAFAARDQDWIDIRSVFIRNRDAVDWRLVMDELRPLAELKEEPQILTKLEELYHDTA